MAASRIEHYITALGALEGVSVVACRCGELFYGTESVSVSFLYERHLEEHLEDD